jgi:hypothetical protein
MPRRVIQSPEHDQDRALHIAVWWIETFTVHGPGDVQGQPSTLVDEYAQFIEDCYAVDADGRRLYDSAFFSRPKGCDKSGLAAKLVLFEAFGPCRFAGFAEEGDSYTFLGKTYYYEPGEPMGREVTAPMVRILATEEDQTGNVFDTVYFNLTEEGMPLRQMQRYGADVGKSRVLLPGGGEITPSTTGASSKDGGKETFVVFDETHLYTTPQLHTMYSTLTRNLRKRKKIAGTWFLETTTMYAPGQDSVAEKTYELAEKIEQGVTRRARLYFNHRYGIVEELVTRSTAEDPRTREEEEAPLRQAILEAYGDAILWNDIEGVLDGIYDPRETEADSRRYFLNALTASANAWVELDVIERAMKAAEGVEFVGLQPGDQITLGFDGSKTEDCTVLVACRVRDRYLFPLHVQQVPDGPEADGWEVDREEVDAAVTNAFDTYDVVGFYADPPFWQDYLDVWQNRYGDDRLRVHASGRHTIEFWTNREVAMSRALERLHTAMKAMTMAFPSGKTKGLTTVEVERIATFRKHFLNARRRYRSRAVLVGKDRKGSPHKIDFVIGAVLAFQAAADFTAKPLPVKHKPVMFVPTKIR